MTLFRTAAAIAVCLVAGAASAQTAPMPKLREVCAADFLKFCPDAAPAHGAVAQCVRAHVQELSPDCRSALMARREAMRERKAEMANTPAPTATTPPN